MTGSGHPPHISWVGRILGLLFGVLVALAFIEMAGRLVMGFDPLPGWAQDFNSRVGYELRPQQQYVYASQSGEFESEVRHNSRGLHDIEHRLEKPAGVYRILILSDSYGHSREVPLEANFARQMESLLNAQAPAGTTYEVINAGHFGLGTTQEYLYYRTEGRRYQPDLVLLGFYIGNDVVDNHAPLIAAWNGSETVDFPYFTPDGELHQPGMSFQRRWLSWLRQNSFLVNTLAGGPPPDRVEVGDPSRITEQALRVPMGVYLPPDDTWQAAWAVTDRALGALQSAVAQDGAQFAVFIIPDRRQIYEEDWQATLAKLPDLDPATLDRERPTRTLADLLAARAIPAFDLREPFSVSSERLYFAVDGHFNAAGHRLVAQLLADWLTQLARAEGPL